MYQGGYTGQILRVNLTDKTFKKEKLPSKVAKDFIGDIPAFEISKG
jgi:aldehyde:ferredoxin oxidoreductase